jgi:low temperature requirement protein LtrA
MLIPRNSVRPSTSCPHHRANQLFFDLFLVAAVSAVVHIFVDDPTWRGAGRFLLYLGLFHFSWTSSTVGRRLGRALESQSK